VIRAFLQMSHAFGGDVIVLQESLGKESADDCMEFLIEISTTSIQLLERSETLASIAITLAKEFSSWAPSFETTLRNSKTHVDRTNFGRYESERLTKETQPLDSRENLPQGYAGQWIERPIVVERSIADKATQAFVEANIAAIRPDGWKSLDDTINALDNMNSMLTQFIQYWQATSKSCQLYILNRSINIKPAEAESFATKWRANRAALDGAILAIAKSCDAVLVDAVGAPPRSPTRGATLSPSGHGTRLVKPVRETTPPPPPLPPRANYGRNRGNSWSMGFFGYRD